MQNWDLYRVCYTVPFMKDARVDFAYMAGDGEPDMLGGLSGLGGDDELMGSCWDAINHHMHEVLAAVEGEWVHVKRHVVHQYQNSGILVLWWIEDAPYEPGDTV